METHVSVIIVTYRTPLQTCVILTGNSVIKYTLLVAVAFCLCLLSLAGCHVGKNLLQEQWFKVTSVERFERCSFNVFEDRISPLDTPCKKTHWLVVNSTHTYVCEYSPYNISLIGLYTLHLIELLY